jgi:hypothetical protein
MSALPPKADMCGALGHVCFGPKADIVPFLSDVRSPQDRALSSTVSIYPRSMMIDGCVYRKPKPERNDDEARQGSGVM